jgi:hypothetical protein
MNNPAISAAIKASNKAQNQGPKRRPKSERFFYSCETVNSDPTESTTWRYPVHSFTVCAAKTCSLMATPYPLVPCLSHSSAPWW